MQKQSTNVYTVMLILSFIFVMIACILLYLELSSYGEAPWWNTSGAMPTSMHDSLPLSTPWQNGMA